jgi:hypothetical protein
MTSGPNELKPTLQRLINGNASEADRNSGVTLYGRQINRTLKWSFRAAA